MFNTWLESLKLVMSFLLLHNKTDEHAANLMYEMLIALCFRVKGT